MVNGIDISNPFMQRMIAENPALATQLGLTPPAPAQPPGMTAEQVRQIVAEELAARTPAASPAQAMARLEQFDKVFQKALPAEDFMAFQKYVAAGAPGFADLLTTDKLNPIAQLLWETIKENMP